MTCWTWDGDGNRVERHEKFLPFLYVETSDKTHDAISMFNTKLKKIEFNNDAERRKFVERTDKRLFFNLTVIQQYLLEKYFFISMDDMIKHPLKTFFLDIEVFSPDVFPEAEKADHPINAITVYDNVSEKFYTWGLKNEYDISKISEIGLDIESVVYVPCSNEKSLLECFLNFWKEDYPDLITGWNCSGFDIPYIINRMRRVLGDSSTNLLSPEGRIYTKLKENVFETWYNHYTIVGISDIDYLELYKKSEMNDKESYKLGYIGNLEGVDGKVEFESSNLASLSIEDWDKFITYNIQDVNIMVKLEAKKRYLNVARRKAYRGFSPIDKALDSVPIVTGLIAKAGLDQNQIIVTYKPNDVGEKFDGGFVFKPSGKVHRGIVSFDVNSLYPNTMITLNTSPETKVGKVHPTGNNNYILQLENGVNKKITGDQLKSLIQKNNLILSKANVLFSQDRMGICAKFLDDMYKERKMIQKRMAETEDKSLKEKLDIEQYLLKILLNSVYGVFGNRFFGLYDLDIAKSVTLTGQAMIKKSTDIVKTYAEQVAKVEDVSDIVVYGDTDSNFFDFGIILDKLKVPFFEEIGDTIKVTEDAIKVIDSVESYLNQQINKWAKSQLNSQDPRYHFSREKICLNGIFLTKKNYILRVLNNEGFDCDKIVEKGVELVKSTHSEAVKNLIRSVVYCIFYEKGREAADKKYLEALDSFKTFGVDDISRRQNVKNHEKYADLAKGVQVALNTPYVHKGAIYYNNLIQDLDLGGKYPKISSGQKVKHVYLKKNRFGFKGIAFNDRLPEEFDLHPDYDYQFKKMVLPLIERCYKGSGWQLPDVDKLTDTNLFEFLGIKI